MELEIVKRETWEGEIERPFLVIAYYTMGSPYEAEATVLKLSLEALGYPHEICGVQDVGTWQQNTQLKAKFVRQMLIEFPDYPLLYLDVDAVVVQELLVLQDINADIAAVHYCGDGGLLSGTIYFGGTEKCRQAVDKWIWFNEQYPEKLPDNRPAWDQRTLKMAISDVSCRYVELPQAYTWIVQITQSKMPGLAPVIMHTRGKWRFKKKIDEKKRLRVEREITRQRIAEKKRRRESK